MILAVMMASPARAVVDNDWDANGGTGGDWDVAANWSLDVVPDGDDDCFFYTATSAGSPGVVDSAVDKVNRLRLGETSGGASGTGYLTLNSGGDLEVQKWTYVGRVAGGTGVFNMTGGSFHTGNANNTGLNIGLAGTGTVNMSGGTYSVGHAGSETAIGTGSGTGVLVVSDAADLNLNEDFFVGGGTGSGLLVLDGSLSSGDDIVMSRGGDNRVQFLDNATLRAIIDQDAVDDAGAMRKIDCTSGQNSSSNALFELGSLLDLQFDTGVTPTSGTWTLMTTVAGITDNGLALAGGVDPGWTFSTDNNALTVTYTAPAGIIPEPATMLALLAGAGALGGYARRRRR
jgi:hypothetical protein